MLRNGQALLTLVTPYKRFAQLALVCFALAGVTSCGGGGSTTPTPTPTPPTPTPTPPTPTPTPPTPTPTPPTPTPPTPTPTPPTPTPTPPTPTDEYGAIIYGHYTSADRRSGRWAWGLATGTSASQARSRARAECERRLGRSCSTWTLNVVPNACGAVAESACPANLCIVPASGGASARTRRQAETSAISTCERGVIIPSARGTCAISTDDRGEPGVICVGTAR